MAFMPVILFGFYVGNSNTLSLSAIVMTNMMIKNISERMDSMNNFIKFAMSLSEAIKRISKFYLMPDKQKGLVN